MSLILKAAIPLFLILLIACAHAYSIDRIDVSFDVAADGSVRQTNVFSFNESLPNTTTLEYNLSEQVKNIAASSDAGPINPIIDKIGTGYVVVIPLTSPIRVLNLSYVTGSTVFKSDSVSIFFTELSFGTNVGNMTVTAKLPEGYGLYQNSYSPLNGGISSDGKRIILSWSDVNVNVPIVFSIKYMELNGGNEVLLGIVVVLVGVIILGFLYFRERTREEFLRGFREDEKKTIEYIHLQKIAMQSDLQKQFNFSRAKATRIVAVLEQKGLITKKRYGRTNKLIWNKK